MLPSGRVCGNRDSLKKFDILSPDEIERLAEKLATLYQDDIEQRFSDNNIWPEWQFLTWLATSL